MTTNLMTCEGHRMLKKQHWPMGHINLACHETHRAVLVTVKSSEDMKNQVQEVKKGGLH